MQDRTAMLSADVIGIDLGRKNSQVAVVRGGQVVEEFGVASTPAAFTKAFEGRDRCRVVMEVSGPSPWVSRLLSELGFEAWVVASDSLKAAFKQRQKNDKSDARALAMMGASCAQLLRRVEHRTEAAQRDMATLRIRDTLVRARTQLVNEVRGILASLGMPLPACSTSVFAKRVHSLLSDEDKSLVAPALRQITALTHEIKEIERGDDLLRADLRADRGHGVLERAQKAHDLGPADVRARIQGGFADAWADSVLLHAQRTARSPSR